MTKILEDATKDDLVEALESNLMEQIKYYGQSPLADFYNGQDYIRLSTGLRGSNFNQITATNLRVDNIDNAIDTAVQPFREKKAPAIWWVGPSSHPKTLATDLETSGFQKVYDMPGVFRQLSDMQAPSDAPDNFEIRIVSNEQELQTWANTQEKGFETFGTAKIFYQFEASLGTDEKSPWTRYIGYLDNEPVGTSILFLASGVAAIYNVSAIPKFRRKGVGSLMTILPLMKARDLGYHYGVLKSTPVGMNLYRSLDFEKCCD
ncbi:MAG: GNAT family N-acetyltransferase, partial [Candidatus Kariarchaeaceae archaeon]